MEHSLLSKATALSEEIEQCSAERLQPFLAQIEQLSSNYQRLSRALSSRLPSANDLTVRRPAHDLTGAPSTTSGIARGNDAAVDVLRLALSSIGDIQREIADVQDFSKVGRGQTPRDVHIQDILTLQRRRLPDSTFAREKILLICACKSIAKDFRAFELRSGWIPKQDQLERRIIAGYDPCVQKIGKHLKNYIAAQCLLTPSLRAKFDAAIRFGIKLEVVDAVGRAVGLHGCVSLLLGFECVKFTRLSYASFIPMRAALCLDSDLLSSLAYFDAKMCVWWADYQENYHRQFGNSDTRPTKLHEAPCLPTLAECEPTSPPLEVPGQASDQCRALPLDCNAWTWTDTPRSYSSHDTNSSPRAASSSTDLSPATTGFEFSPLQQKQVFMPKICGSEAGESMTHGNPYEYASLSVALSSENWFAAVVAPETNIELQNSAPFGLI